MSAKMWNSEQSDMEINCWEELADLEHNLGYQLNLAAGAHPASMAVLQPRPSSSRHSQPASSCNFASLPPAVSYMDNSAYPLPSHYPNLPPAYRYSQPPPHPATTTAASAAAAAAASCRGRFGLQVVDTSVPPPRLTKITARPVLPRPSNAATKASSTSTSSSALADSSPFPCSQPVVKIVGDDEHRTPYCAPGPKVKILKRPSSTPSNLSAQGGGPSPESASDAPLTRGGPALDRKSATAKSLKQREEEYAQARLRILGSTGKDCDSQTAADPKDIKEKPPVSAVSCRYATTNVMRAPRGPDGSTGFKN